MFTIKERSSAVPPSLFHPVDLEKLSSLHSRLDSISKLSLDFLVLLAGSTVIATLGLFQNSPAVIIGAMIIAPLMRPLLGLSLATLTGDSRLLIRASITLLVGSIVGVVIAATTASLLRSLELTPEILGRTHANLLDLAVAFAAGAIGAYCHADEKLADTLAGVAIAVALVPPLSVVGIGLTLGSVPVWSGAALLYATNLVGITIAGALVFLLRGYIPLKSARKGLAISAAVATILMIPLALSMRELVLENQISGKIQNVLKEKTFTFRHARLKDVQVKRSQTPMSVIATVFATDLPIKPRQIKLVQDFLSKEIGIPIEFRLRIIPVTELTATDLIQENEVTASPDIINASLTDQPERPQQAKIAPLNFDDHPEVQPTVRPASVIRTGTSVSDVEPPTNP